MRYLLTLLAVLIVSPAYAQDEAAGSGETQVEAEQETAADDPTYERRLELARQMHEIWPTRLKVEKALNHAASKMPVQNRAAFKSGMRQAIKYKLLEEDSIDAMVKVFTVEELEAMVEFHGSEIGRAVNSKIDLYQAEIAPSFTRMMDKALMDVKTGSTPGNIQ